MNLPKKKLLLPDSITALGWDLLKNRDDVEGVPFRSNLGTKEFHALLADAAGVGLSSTPMTELEIAAAPQLRVVARIGVGYDTVDVPALTRRRIPLMITGTANSVSVAEHAVYFMLSLIKRGGEINLAAREQGWPTRYELLPGELYGRTLLVVGFGRIGTRIAARCLAMEMTVVVYDPFIAPEKIRAAGCEPVEDLDLALPRADFVTIHCPKNSETTGMFDRARLSRMKPSAYLVNTARGGIVDERALHNVLAEGSIAGAALDVFEREPTPLDNPLFGLKNLLRFA